AGAGRMTTIDTVHFKDRLQEVDPIPMPEPLLTGGSVNMRQLMDWSRELPEDIRDDYVTEWIDFVQERIGLQGPERTEHELLERIARAIRREKSGATPLVDLNIG